MSFEPAQVDRMGSLQNLKDLASVMSSEAGAAHRNDIPLNIVETPHLRINSPKEHRASLETMQFNDTQSPSGVDRGEEGDRQIAHESDFEFAGIGRDVGVFGMNVSNQGAVARILRAHDDAPGLERTHIALHGLLTVFGKTKHLGRRH